MFVLFKFFLGKHRKEFLSWGSDLLYLWTSFFQHVDLWRIVRPWSIVGKWFPPQRLIPFRSHPLRAVFYWTKEADTGSIQVFTRAWQHVSHWLVNMESYFCKNSIKNPPLFTNNSGVSLTANSKIVFHTTVTMYFYNSSGFKNTLLSKIRVKKMDDWTFFYYTND